MNVEDLAANAAINIGLAILFLVLFSVFSKQPGNAGVYFTRDLLKDERNTDKERRTLSSFVPSVGWLIRAYRVSEEEILKDAGLDAVVFLRIFVFSMRLFGVCSLIGVFILVPTTYSVSHTEDVEDFVTKNFDRFTISNLEVGSKRFWIHFGALYVISILIYVMLYMEYFTITKMRLQYIFDVISRPDQFSILVRAIPKDKDGKPLTDFVKDVFTQLHPDTYLSHQMVYKAPKVEGLIGKLNKMKREIDGLKKKPPNERQRRDGFCGLYGQKVDRLEKKVRQLEELYQKIGDLQHDILDNQEEVGSAIVSFKSRWGAAVAAQTQQVENPLHWVTEWAPEPRDVYWSNLSVPSAEAWLRQILAGVAVILITLWYCVPSTAIVAINNVTDVIKLLQKAGLPTAVTGPIEAILRLPGVEQLVSGYFSTVLLAVLLYFIPPIMLFLSRLEGYSSKSTQERMATEKFFYFLAGPIFFIQVLGGGLIDIATEWELIENPADLPYRLAYLLPGQATFFMSYIMTTGWAGFPLEILNFGTVALNMLKRHTINDDTRPELVLYSLQYYRNVPNILLFIFVGVVYSIIAPLLPPFLLIYFALGYVVFKNQIIHVYEPAYETAGLYWPVVHNRIIAALFFMQITFFGIFEIKMSNRVSIATLPLPVFTVMFYYYCNKRFYPVFEDLSVETTKNKDMDDERRGITGEIYNHISEAYLHPGLKPVDITGYANPEADHLLA